MRFTLVGLDGATWRVTGDTLSPGMSGGPVLNLATGRIAGLVKAKLDADDGRANGGWIVDVEDIRGAFAGLGDRNECIHPRLSPWRVLATRRNDLTCAVLGSGLRTPEPRGQPTRRPGGWTRATT